MKLFQIYNRLEQIEDLFCQVEESALKRSDRKFTAQWTKEEARTIAMLQSLLNDLLDAIPKGDIDKLDCVKHELV
jgi:Na+/phosphate symporter